MGGGKPGVLKLMMVILFVLPQSSVRRMEVGRVRTAEVKRADRPQNLGKTRDVYKRETEREGERDQQEVSDKTPKTAAQMMDFGCGDVKKGRFHMRNPDLKKINSSL